MRAILPGRPQSKRQALCTAHWDGLRLVAYISGNTAIILRNPKDIVQTISIDHVENLSAITIEETSGRIALCNDDRVLIFNAVGRDEDDLRWIQVHDIAIVDGGTARSLSWGSPEELLVGGTQLWLYHLPYSDGPRLIWQQPVANEIAMAYFSDDAEIIASCGHHDRLVKIWRRISFELDSTRFDVSYLPHPAAVTDMHWRKPWHNEQDLDSLLYTFCADNQVRVWSYSDPHTISVVQLIATIDTNKSIEPRRRSIGSISRKRYVMIFDSRDFSHATEKAIQQSPNNHVDHALEHLVEIANRSPEVCIVFDGLGHMSVLGLENAGCKSRKPTVVFNVTLVDRVDVQLNFPHVQDEDYTKLCVFGGGSNPAALSLLVQTYTGQIDWYESSITHFFDTSSRDDRVRLLSSWAGHDLAVDHIARGVGGNAILSWTDEGQAILWSQNPSGALCRKCEIDINHIVLSIVVIDRAGYVVALHGDSISVWNVQSARGVRVAREALDKTKTPLSLHATDLAAHAADVFYFILTFDGGSQEIWRFSMSARQKQQTTMNGSSAYLTRISELTNRDSLDQQIVPCDVASSTDSVQFIGIPNFKIDASGEIKCVQTLQESPSEKPRQVIKRCTSTNIRDPLLSRSSAFGKCAIVTDNKRNLTIWDLGQGCCEWRYEYDGTDEIQKLVWNSTPHGNHLLFIGFSYHALVVGQLRYPNVSNQQSAWYITQNISMRDFTNIHIGDACWLPSGDLALGAGNQIFVLESHVTERNSPILKRSQNVVGSNATAAIVDMANSALPVFHPDLLEALIIEHGILCVETIFRRLYERLKYFAEGDELPSDLELSMTDLLSSKDDRSTKVSIYLNGDDTALFELESIEDSFIEYLDNTDIWQLGPRKRQKLADVFVSLIKIGRHRNSLDENALRYLYYLYSTPEDQDLPWRAYVFASRSTSHEALVDLITRHHNDRLTWSVARRTGLFIWLEDIVALQTQLENVARTEYTMHEDRNPVNCSLYYLALNKKSVLQGLWRRTFGIREKENTLKLLANNFNEAKWRSTALKNAYALLSKRRFEYGAAFFLLGGGLDDAVNVCVNQLHDIQLAIAITRVWDRDPKQSQEVLQNLLHRTILAKSVDDEQGRWMAAWAYATLKQPIQAVQSLVRPLHLVVASDLNQHTGPLRSMSFRANDPHLRILYIQLREMLYKQNTWTSAALSQKEEFDFAIRSAQWWTRAGMDHLALQILREWKFVQHQEPRLKIAPTTLVAIPQDSSHNQTDSSINSIQEVKKTAPKPPPTQFYEPSADSLLDSFGF